MARVIVTTNQNPPFFIEINLNDQKWSILQPNNLPPFKIEELKRPCPAYPNGIFPGGEENSTDKQISRVCNFTNYIEFSKIVSDELTSISEQQFLTTKFYNRRKDGWESTKPLQKKGGVQGYCLNGDVYGISGQETVEKIFYGVVYRSLVQKIPEFIYLQQSLRDGMCLILTGSDEIFLGYLAEVLLMSVQSR